MPTPVTIQLKSTGAQTVTTDLQAVARTLTDDARAASHLAQTMTFAARDADALARNMARAAQGAAMSLRQQAADARAAASAQVSAARQATQAQKGLGNAAKGAGDALVAGMDKSSRAADRLVAKLHHAGAAINNMKQQGGAYENLGESRDFGAKLLLGGTAGFALAGKTALDAGEFNRMRAGIRGQLGQEGGDSFLTDLQKFDRRSPFDLKETISQGQSALAMGFKPEELINKDQTGLFDQLGDAIARAGGNAENFSAAMRQIAQIKSKGGASMQDLNALAEGGKLAIIPMVKQILGEARAKEVLSGDKKLTEEEFFGKIIPAIGAQNKGGMDDAMKELPGQIETLQGALWNLSQTIGQSVVPVVSFLATAATWLADALASWPKPVLTFLVILGLLGSGILTVGGTVLILIALFGQLMIGLEAFKATALGAAIASKVAAIGVGTLALTLFALAATAVIVVASIIIGINNWNDAISQSDTQFKKSHGTLSTLVDAFGAMDKAIYKVLDTIAHVLTLGLYKGQDQVNDETDRKIYEAQMVTNKKIGKPVVSFEEWQAQQKAADKLGGKDGGEAAQEAADKAAAKAPSEKVPTVADLGDLGKLLNDSKAGLLPSTQNLDVPTISGAAPSTATYGGDIRSMQRALKTMPSGKEFAPQRKALGLQIFDAQTEKSADAARERQSKKEEAELRKQGRHAEAEAKKAQRAKEKAAREAAAYESKVNEQMHRGERQRLDAELRAKVKAKTMTADAARAQLQAFDNDFARRKLGLSGSFGDTTTQGGTNGPQMGAISENEKPWIGYTRGLSGVGGMPQADALKYITKQSAYFEKGGFESEAQMSAWQRAYTERYGKTDFPNMMLGNVSLNAQGTPQMPAYNGYSGAANNAGDSGGALGAQMGESGPYAVNAGFEAAGSVVGGNLLVRFVANDVKIPISDIIKAGGARTQNDVRKIKRGVA